MGNKKRKHRKEGLNVRSAIKSEKARMREIQKGMEAFRKSREDADEFLV